MIKILVLFCLELIILISIYRGFTVQIKNTKFSLFSLSLILFALLAINLKMLFYDSTQFLVYNHIPQYISYYYPEANYIVGEKDIIGNDTHYQLHLEPIQDIWYKNDLDTTLKNEHEKLTSNISLILDTLNYLKTLISKEQLYLSSLLGIIFTMFICVFFFRYIFIILYTKKLKFSLEEYHHRWMGENNLSDIMVSINIFENKVNENLEYDLIEFFKEKFEYSPEMPYLLLGNAGEGKTISLVKLADFLCQNHMSIKKENSNKNKLNYKKIRLFPILLYFHDLKYITSEIQILDVILDKMDELIQNKIIHYIIKHFENNIKWIIQRYIERGQLVLLIDGYDEIKEEQRLDVSRALNKFMTLHPNCFLIMTSRLTVFKEEKFLKINESGCLFLSNFNRKQVELFLQKWDFPKGKSRRQLYNQIIKNPCLEKLSKNPLLLTLITYLYIDKELSSPLNTTNFYDESMNCLTDTWEHEKGILKRFDIRRVEKLNLLSFIAYYLFIKKQIYLTDQDLLDIRIEYHNRYGYELDKTLEIVYLESGILEKLYDGSIKFYHRSFQEFFMARYLKENNLNIQILYDDIKQNSQIILFFLTLCQDTNLVESFIEKYSDNDYLIGQILQEYTIHDIAIVQTWMNARIQNILEEKHTYLPLLGSILIKYPELQEEAGIQLMQLMCDKSYEEFNGEILSCILSFSKKDLAINLLKQYAYSTDISKLLNNPDREVLDLLKELLEEDLDTDLRWTLTRILSKNQQFYILLDLFMKANNEYNRTIAAMGLIYMSKNVFFYDWLNETDIISPLSEQIQAIIKKYSKFYGWRGENLESKQLNNRFVLVYYACEYLNIVSEVDDKMEIDNRLKYIITYVKNDVNKSCANYMVDIEGFQFKSITEFTYHWKNTRNFKGLEYNPNATRHLIVISFAIFNIILMSLFLYQWYRPYLNMRQETQYLFYTLEKELVCGKEQWENEITIKLASDFYSGYKYNINFNDIGRIKNYNGEFILFLVIWYSTLIYGLYQLIEKEYTYAAKLTNVIYGEILLLIYFYAVQNIWFRINALWLIGIIVSLFLKKHKSNYPSFRNPQYQLIRKYLSDL